MNKLKLQNLKEELDGTAQAKQEISDTMTKAFDPIIQTINKINQKKIEDLKKDAEKELKAIKKIVADNADVFERLGKDDRNLQDQIQEIEDILHDIDNYFIEINKSIDDFNDFKSDTSKYDDLASKDEALRKEVMDILTKIGKKVIGIEKLPYKSQLEVLERDVKKLSEVDHTPLFNGINKRLNDFEDIMKKVSKGIYEYGASLGVSVNGSSVGNAVQNIDFVNGTNTDITFTVDNTGVHIKVNASGLTRITITGTVNGSNNIFTATSEPEWIVSDGLWYEQEDYNGNTQWTYVLGTITTNFYPQTAIWGF